MILATLALFDGPLDSPFIVPVAGCFMVLGIVVVSIWSGVRSREMQNQERLAAIARGIALPPVAEEIVRPISDGIRKRNGVRTGGIVLAGLAAGLILFFITLAHILQTREILSGAAASLIPLGIGAGLLIDARIRTRELESAAVAGEIMR